MKKKPRHYHYLLALCFVALFAMSILDLILKIKPVKEKLFPGAQVLRNEEFDPSLSYINSVQKLDDHITYLVKKQGDEKRHTGLYPQLLGEVIRKRFYHGLYTYSFGNNFLAYAVAKTTGKSVNEVWGADEILQSEYAFCGQQSLVMMNLLKNKGYDVRAIKMFAPEYKTGHFALEVRYDNGWHFFDPDLEPDQKILNNLNRPSFADLKTNPGLLNTVYHNSDKQVITALFSNFRIGATNQLMPRYIYFFQSVTKFLSSICWLLCLLFYVLFLRKYDFSLGVFSFRGRYVSVLHPMQS
jgi:hypothetical protein